MTSRILMLALIASLSLGISACSGKKDKAEKPETKISATADKVEPVEVLYNKAAQLLDSKNYKAAALAFDEVERQYPYSGWATRAQLMSGYSHYRDLKYDEAILGLDRFIQLHPGNENIAYAHYLRALCYYEQISDVRRDQRMTELAMDTLTQVVNRYPESRYARDAALKIDLTLDHLAGKEMEIGRYYLMKDQYNAAINRFQTVIDEYQTTTHVPEALHRLTEAYYALGIRAEAEKTAAILGHNYPDSDWYKDSYALLKGERRKDTSAPKSFYERTLGRVF
jgi:outer membrane protein assembly factor BamD